jgi:hypothetical protein
MTDFEILRADLRAAKVKHANDQKAGALMALEAVSGFLRAQGATSEEMLPISWLLHDMADQGGSPGKPTFEVGRYAIAAAAVDLLKEAGFSLDRACLDVARQTNGRISKTQIKDYRKNMNAGRAKPEAQDIYVKTKQAIRANLKELAPDKTKWRTPILAAVADAFGKHKV